MSDPSEPARKGSWLTRWRAPRQQARQLATLQEGFNELVGLTRSIREHMDQQSQTQKTLTELLSHVPDAVAGLKQVGQATQQQTETLGLLKKQLEAAARNEGHMVESMRQFNQTLTLMDDLSKSTSQTVHSMADRTRDSEEMLRAVLERSERRLIYMIVGLMVLTLTVLGVGLYIGLGQREAVTPPPPPAPAVEEDVTPNLLPPGKRIMDLIVDDEEEDIEPEAEPAEPDTDEHPPEALPADDDAVEEDFIMVPEPVTDLDEATDLEAVEEDKPIEDTPSETEVDENEERDMPAPADYLIEEPVPSPPAVPTEEPADEDEDTADDNVVDDSEENDTEDVPEADDEAEEA